jgi:hypothetical protein
MVSKKRKKQNSVYNQQNIIPISYTKSVKSIFCTGDKYSYYEEDLSFKSNATRNKNTLNKILSFLPSAICCVINYLKSHF